MFKSQLSALVVVSGVLLSGAAFAADQTTPTNPQSVTPNQLQQKLQPSGKTAEAQPKTTQKKHVAQNKSQTGKTDQTSKLPEQGNTTTKTPPPAQ